jgi:hypothetical protein
MQSRPSRRRPAARALSLPAGDLPQHRHRIPTLARRGIQADVLRHQLRPHRLEPIEHPHEIAQRFAGVAQSLDDQRRRLAGGNPLQHV